MGQKTAENTPLFSMVCTKKVTFFALFLFDYNVVTFNTPVTPIYFRFFFFNSQEGYSIRVTKETGSHLKLR